ncbi:MAG: UDP-2,4-diacetamido-2,4,6-trideoxy-beta-L-altropyranose hydrolase [Candidatus Sulfotelmatobacter sp.]
MVEGTLLIRADASVQMGTGHVMRCFALAQAWQDSGGRAVFAMVQPLPSMRQRLLAEGMEVVPIEAEPGTCDDARRVSELANQCGAAWVVVDGYCFDAVYQRELKIAELQVLFVDDNAHSDHYAADLVLNQNANADESLYPNREPYTRLLLGSRYVMLRREFEPWRKWKREIPVLGHKILITMGGSDPDNITLLAIKALAEVGIQGLEAVVVVGGSNPHLRSLEGAVGVCGRLVRLQRNATNMPELMAWADLALIAAGGTLWELLFMGCSVLSYARNPVQGAIISELGWQGVVRDLGNAQNFDPALLGAAVMELAESPESRRRMLVSGHERVDGRGAGRICELLITHETHNLPR